jgi:transcriptional regulator with XRE-family HTH domain
MLDGMDVIRFGLGMRALRIRKGWTQRHLGSLVRISSSVISRIERGRADRVAVHALVRVAARLDARVDVRLLWRGEGLDRLLDARHASLVDRMMSILESAGWDATAEATFDVRGQRGSIDILAFHPSTGSVLVIEVKSVVPDLQAMLSGLDRKTRLARELAGTRGWRATSVSRVLVLPDDRTARRRVDRHAATFRKTLPARTAEVRRWIRRPAEPMSGILFLADAPQVHTRHRVSAKRPPT